MIFFCFFPPKWNKKELSSTMDIFSYFSDAQSPIADNVLPPFFPKAPKQCESTSQPFFSCLSVNSTKLGNLLLLLHVTVQTY